MVMRLAVARHPPPGMTRFERTGPLDRRVTLVDKSLTTHSVTGPSQADHPARPLLYGVGPDGVGGTADDPDVDFAEDIDTPNEGITGLEDTLNNTAWGFSRSRR